MANIILRLAVIEKSEKGDETAVRTTALKFPPEVILIFTHSKLTFLLKTELHDVVSQMREKLGSQAQVVKLGPETDYGLFAPEEPGSKSGTWLDLDLQIGDYMEEGRSVVLKSGVSNPNMEVTS